MPISPDILVPTATCELEQEKMRFMAGARARATGGRGTRGERGQRFPNPLNLVAAVQERAVKSRAGPAPGPAPLNQTQESKDWT